MNFNPNHPTTRAVDGQWHKLLAMAMNKLGIDEVALSMDDLDALISRNVHVVVIDGVAGDGLLHIRLVDQAKAEAMARREGGLPS